MTKLEVAGAILDRALTLRAAGAPSAGDRAAR